MKINSKLPLLFFLILLSSIFKYSVGQAAMVKVTIEHNPDDSFDLLMFLVVLIVLVVFILIFLLFKKRK